VVYIQCTCLPNDAGGSESDEAELSDNSLMALTYHELADRRKNGK